MDAVKKLITDFAAHIGIDKPLFVANVAAIQFDEMILNLHADEENQEATLFMEMGAVPADADAKLSLYSNLLRLNNFGRDTAGGIFGVDPRDSLVSFSRTFSVQQMELGQFSRIMEAFLNLAESLRSRIDESKIVATPAPAVSAHPQGGMRV